MNKRKDRESKYLETYSMGRVGALLLLLGLTSLTACHKDTNVPVQAPFAKSVAIYNNGAREATLYIQELDGYKFAIVVDGTGHGVGICDITPSTRHFDLMQTPIQVILETSTNGFK